jgi:hypothetical protein
LEQLFGQGVIDRVRINDRMLANGFTAGPRAPPELEEARQQLVIYHILAPHVAPAYSAPVRGQGSVLAVGAELRDRNAGGEHVDPRASAMIGVMVADVKCHHQLHFGEGNLKLCTSHVSLQEAHEKACQISSFRNLEFRPWLPLPTGKHHRSYGAWQLGGHVT